MHQKTLQLFQGGRREEGGQVPPLAHGSMLQCSGNSVNARLIIRMIQQILPARYPGARAPNERMDLRGDWIELHHIWTGHTVDRSSAPPKSFFHISYMLIQGRNHG